MIKAAMTTPQYQSYGGTTARTDTSPLSRLDVFKRPPDPETLAKVSPVVGLTSRLFVVVQLLTSAIRLQICHWCDANLRSSDYEKCVFTPDHRAGCANLVNPGTVHCTTVTACSFHGLMVFCRVVECGSGGTRLFLVGSGSNPTLNWRFYF